MKPGMTDPVRVGLWHHLQVKEFYCPPCETAVCEDCSSGEHAEHPTVPLKEAVEQHKISLQDQLSAAKKR